MILALQQILVVVLRVDIDEVRSELTQESGSDRTLIDPDAAFAFRVDLPADDQFIFVDVESLLFQDGTGRRALPQGEHAFDEGAVRPFLDIARRSPLSAKQAMASINNDFPAPVSPVKTLMRLSKSSLTASISTKFFT